MLYGKLQIGLLVVLVYIAFIYLYQCYKYRIKDKKKLFDMLLFLAIISVAFDGITVYTVNNLDSVNPILNMVLHGLFLVSLDSVIFVLFLYMLYITGVHPKDSRIRVDIILPFIINIIIVVCNLGSLEYVEGAITNYSMGVSAYTCFIMAAVYIFLSLAVFIKRWNYIESHKRVSIFTYLIVLAVVTLLQMCFPETLISSIAVTIIILGIYMNLENPALKQLSYYHNEAVMSFANIVENRDQNTGGHIKRTSKYVELIALELRNRGCYSEVLTKDYISNLLKAAPMHDIGKISVPDAILQKPGKLTDEEYDIMKKHSTDGGRIIKETFSNLGDEEYLEIAYKVATHHHEKWNGRGYPDGLKEKEIPLCARIMAVADVFDAISQKRCYREAMPLDKCFNIIEEGSGKDFEPLIVDVFMSIRDKVEDVHKQLNGD